jgi:ubiquinone/menaquinone biosynthesis C-methylase UbiE
LAGWLGKGRAITGVADISKPLPPEQASRTEVEEMVQLVCSLSPTTLVDLASGGGWFISRLLHNCRIERAISVERDVRCLWILQYKFGVARSALRGDAVGGDIRALPLRAKAFDVATCSNAFGEIAGITPMLREAHRVVRRGGHFLLCHSEKPFIAPGIADKDYFHIAHKGDLFVGADELLEAAENNGFRVNRVVAVSRKSDALGRRFVADLICLP